MDLKFVDGTNLWHKSLCYMSWKGMSALAMKNVLFGVKKAHLQKYSHCFAGKQNRVSFKSHRPSRKSEIRDLVHFDDKGISTIILLLLILFLYYYYYYYYYYL